MRAAQAGDRAAYERLLREVMPFVRGVARRHCRNPADIEEALQETLLTVHRVRHTYDPRRPFCPWLAAIAARRTIDGLRRQRRLARHESAQPELADETFGAAAANEELEELRSQTEAQGQLRGLLSQLPTRQREALERLKLQELSLAQAAAVSGQSVGALKVNVHRAMKALRGLVLGRGQ